MTVGGAYEAVSGSEVPSVLAAVREGRCVSCYRLVSLDCPGEHVFYCCSCDDNDDCTGVQR